MTPAIRVLKRGPQGLHAVHFLLDPGRTMCGRHVDELQVVEETELEKLPTLEGCRGCVRFAEGWERQEPSPAAVRVTLPSVPGRLRTTGSLSHGFRRHSGRRLA